MKPGSGAPVDQWVTDQLSTIRDAGQWRELRPFNALGPRGCLEGNPVVSFASNDYLGLAAHPAVVGAAKEAIVRWGAGATASRLVVGSRDLHTELEAELAGWKGTEAALLFSSGYTANLGVLTVFGGPDCTIVSDELNHASIIDGCRLSRSPVAIARHNDPTHVAELLAGRETPRAIVIVDAIYSMDGDAAPVDALAELCVEHGALLILDEAHSVFGPDMSAVTVVPDLHVVRVVTLSKSLGAMGGAVCTSAPLVELLVNRARSFIFTTGLSPADTAAALAALRLLRTSEGPELVARVRKHVDRVAPDHPSPIVPIIVGQEEATLEASRQLLASGVHVPAIRPPTVAPGTSRLRLAFNASHTTEDVDQLVETLDRLGLRWNDGRRS